MSDAWLAFLVIFAMLLAIWRIADGRERPMTKSEQERMFFRQTYSLSIDRMLSESPLDRDEVRRLRDSGRYHSTRMSSNIYIIMQFIDIHRLYIFKRYLF